MFIPDKTTPELRKITVGGEVLHGQTTIATTGVAVKLSNNSSELKNGVIIQALSGNAGNVYVGGESVTTSNGFELQAGQATSVAAARLDIVYINGTAGDGVCYIAVK